VLVDVLLWLPRTLASAWGWGWGKVKRRAADRQALVKEGSEVVSRVQHFTESIGPASIMVGSDEQISEYLQERHRTWHQDLRGPLRTYSNAHPSDTVRSLGNAVEIAVAADLSSTIYLRSTLNTATGGFEEAERLHKEALSLGRRLMKAIRDY
jgi:hypothetical protein